MGDRVYTTIRFAGVINEEDVDDLLEAIDADGLITDDGPEGPDLMREHLAFQFYDAECNYGQLDNAEAAAKKLGISYCKTWQEGGGFGPGMDVYNAVTGVTLTCGMLDGEPAVSLSDLKRLGENGIVPYLEAFGDFEENYGTLEIKLMDDVA